MAITLVHQSSGSGTTPTYTVSITPTLAGNLLVVVIHIDEGVVDVAITSITDNVGNTYAQCTGAYSEDDNIFHAMDIWYAKDIVAGATTLTITTDDTGSFADADVLEFSNVSTTTAFVSGANLIVSSEGDPENIVGASMTPTDGGQLLINAVFANSTNMTGVDSPFTGFGISEASAGTWDAYTINPALSPTQANFEPIGPDTYIASSALFNPGASGPSAAQQASTFLVF
jgi:hypothetical protein